MDSLQDRYAPHNRCFGCGAANDQGLRIKSFVAGDRVVATWTPSPHHLAFPGVLNGGICGALLDCHSNWTAAYALMQAQGAAAPPCTVTAEFHVKLKRPTPMDQPLELAAWVVELTGEPPAAGAVAPQAATPPTRAVIEATLTAGGKVTATCRGVFVAVREGHPAFHRW